jgi:hypothetical protein
MANPKELEMYNKMYIYKKNLENRNIVFYITDKDLIELNNDKSEVLYLRIIKEFIEKLDEEILKSPEKVPNIQSEKAPNTQPEKIYIPHYSKHLPKSLSFGLPIPKPTNKRKSYDNENSPRSHKRRSYDNDNSPRPKRKSHSPRSPSPQNSPRKNSPKKSPKNPIKILQKEITIKNIKYIIVYKETNDMYPVFKIKYRDDKISCTGTHDNKIDGTQLVLNKYDIIEINHNGFNYEIFTPEFDHFISPMIVEIMGGKMCMTVDMFMDMFVNIINQIKL